MSKYQLHLCHVWTTEIEANSKEEAEEIALSKLSETMVVNSETGELDEKFHDEVVFELTGNSKCSL